MGHLSTHRVSTLMATGFAVWVLALWLWPINVMQKVEEDKKPMETVTEENQETPKPTRQATLVLPAPPPPAKADVTQAKAPVATPDPVLPPQTAPVQKPVEKAADPEKPEPKAVSKPTKARQQERPPEPEVIVEPTDVQIAEGRALLKVLEHGKGPLIEIAWPASSERRESLYRAFQNCYGMENALMSRDGDLFRFQDPRARRWEINLDRYSGFIREAAGHLPRAEQSRLKDIERRHGRLYDATPVRVFPRALDARLLGALSQMVGAGYDKSQSIQARYHLEGNRVAITDVHVDGRKLSGRINLPFYSRCSGRV